MREEERLFLVDLTCSIVTARIGHVFAQISYCSAQIDHTFARTDSISAQMQQKTGNSNDRTDPTSSNPTQKTLHTTYAEDTLHLTGCFIYTFMIICTVSADIAKCLTDEPAINACVFLSSN